VRADRAAAAEGPEEAVRVRELGDQRLRLDDLGDDPRGVADPSERLGVRPGVVADPVAIGVRALRERAPLRLDELGAEDEERRSYAGRLEDVEDPVGDGRLGAVVER
jgi:hypothetical protein